ncbi:MAG: LytTR family DNA-binding domain-containing protein [Candidatus Saccharimonadaceae bacterium]
MIKDYIHQPYRLIDNKWKLIILISSFIALFILLFQPFGLSEYKSTYKPLVLLGYGGVTFIIQVINLFLIMRIFKKWFTQWTILKQIIWISWIIFTIGVANYFYSAMIFPIFAGIKGFLIFQLFTLIIGIFPVVTMTLITYNIKLSQNLKTAAEVNDLLIAKPTESHVDENIVLAGDNKKDKLEIKLSNLIYIESIGNYIQVSYLHNGKLVKTLLRGAIKRIESETTQYPSLVKCHRAFIVNIFQVASVKGNSQELRLALKNSDIEIPVSRNNSQKIKNSLG